MKNIRHELGVLVKYEFDTPHKNNLKSVNNILWDLEDGILKHEKENEFGEKFIEKARNIYKYNDERCRIKKLINIEHGSDIVEEKSY